MRIMEVKISCRSSQAALHPKSRKTQTEVALAERMRVPAELKR